jgi:hypothetical protein
MNDPISTSVRSSILHLLSIPRHYIAQHLSLTELSAVADGLEEIVNAVRRRLDASISPLKSSENKLLGPKRAQLDLCLAKLRRYMTLVAVETLETIEGSLQAIIRGEFKLIHQNIDGVAPLNTFSTLTLEWVEQYSDGMVKRSFETKLCVSDEWIPLWLLKSSPSDKTETQFFVDFEESLINDDILVELHEQASPKDFTKNLFLLALSFLMVDLIQKAQGIQLCSLPFEEVMACFIDSKRSFAKYGHVDFELPDPVNRKRNSESMDTDVDSFTISGKRFFHG